MHSCEGLAGKVGQDGCFLLGCWVDQRVLVMTQPQGSPQDCTPGETMAELLAVAFLIPVALLLGVGAGASPIGVWGGVFTGVDQVGPTSQVERG